MEVVLYLKVEQFFGRSPNTIQVYAHNLKLFWEYLWDKQLDWREVNLEKLSDFIHWLRNPNPGVISIRPQVSKRTEKTINLQGVTIRSKDWQSLLFTSSAP